MIHPKYSPNEAMKRIKLMMNYDSSKTLTENKKMLKEDAGPWERTAAGVVPVAAGVGGAYGGAALAGMTAGAVGGPVGAAIGGGIGLILGALGMNAWLSGDENEEKKITQFMQACDSKEAKAQKYITKSSLNPTDQAKLAKILSKAFNYQTLGMFGGTDDSEETGWRAATKTLEDGATFGDVCAIRAIYGGPAFEKRIISELDDEEQAEFAGTLGVVLQRTLKGDLKVQSGEALGANWWLDNFECLRITNSFVDGWEPQLDPKYQTNFVQVNFKVKGTLKVFNMDNKGRIYIPTGSGIGTPTGKAVACQGDKVTLQKTMTESVQKKNKLREQASFDFDITGMDVSFDDDEKKKPTPTSSNGGGGTHTSEYHNCSGDYQKGCKSDKIKEVQACLGITTDGAFGPKTQEALKDKVKEFRFGFSDDDIKTICDKIKGGKLSPDDVSVEIPQSDNLGGDTDVTSVASDNDDNDMS